MNWDSIEIYINIEDSDQFITELIAAGIDQFSVFDPRELIEFQASSVYYDYIEENLLNQKEVKITVYTENNEQGNAKKDAIFSILKELSRSGIDYHVDIKPISNDWMESWKKFYKPIKIGDKLLIKPSWEKIEDPEGRIIVEIDPSSSFGTGTHETTRLVMRSLENEAAGKKNCLDMGCGSGILAVTGLLLGAEHFTCVDIEEDSRRVTAENMERNGIPSNRYDYILGNVLEDDGVISEVKKQKYDLITANIISSVVIAMKDLFNEVLESGGTVILSGIILDRLNEVQAEYESIGFKLKYINIEGEWASLTLVRP